MRIVGCSKRRSRHAIAAQPHPGRDDVFGRDQPSGGEGQKQRFEADYLAAIQRGVEAVGKDDDHAYCEAAQQGLATAKAYHDWAVQSGCLAGDAAQRVKALDSLKLLVEKSQESAVAACR